MYVSHSYVYVTSMLARMENIFGSLHKTLITTVSSEDTLWDWESTVGDGVTSQCITFHTARVF